MAAAIIFAVQKLGDLVTQKVVFLQGVEDQVKWLKSELEMMQCFLKDAVEKQANDERICKWISDIREVAQDAEDAIDTFILHVDTPRRSRGLLERFVCFPRHVNCLDNLGQKIESIRARLQDIDKSRERYGIQNLDDGMAKPRRSNDHLDQRRLSPWQRDKHVVGMEEDVRKLIQNVAVKEKRGLLVAGIAGMGGIGKSTLARIIYNDGRVANQYVRRAWVCVSSEFNPRETIKELMLQLLEPKDDKLEVLEIMEKSPVRHLQWMLYERLKGKKYFIVLDDVWQEAAWRYLARVFPNEHDIASRVLVTSRNQNIPRGADYVHNLRPLGPDQSWRLFLKKAFKDNANDKCPEELESIGREIVGKCDGLPLAITVVGGLLLEQRQTESGWKKVLRGMNSYLGRSNASVSAILELSYHDLPPQLKSCFLCLSFFREDATIRAEKLIQVWIAAGLISHEGEGEEATMEEIATSYLDELINRNMVQVKNMTKVDQVKNCQIHDLLRELAIKKAKEELNLEIQREGNYTQSLDEKSRHLAIYCSAERLVHLRSLNPHLRTLFMHGAGCVEETPSFNWSKFTLLRVLDFEGFGLKNLPNTIGTLTGLRYLGLRNNNLSELPISFGGLKKLQVLDIARNGFLKMPNIIWEMEGLRHLYVSNAAFDKPLKLDTLKNLQTLTYIPAGKCQIQLTSDLGKLGMYVNKDTDISELCTSLARLKNLVCLKLRTHEGPMPSLDGLVSLLHITQLTLWGRLTTLPSATNFPSNLSHLSLVQTFLKDDPMPVLGKLPKLLYLKLDRAYVGENLVISHDGFSRLKVLYLHWLFRLRSIILQGEGALPELKRLAIYECIDLSTLPMALRFRSNLEEFTFVSSTEIVSKLRGVEISSIPSDWFMRKGI